MSAYLVPVLGFIAIALALFWPSIHRRYRRWRYHRHRRLNPEEDE
jgi:hypothetical protein